MRAVRFICAHVLQKEKMVEDDIEKEKGGLKHERIDHPPLSLYIYIYKIHITFPLQRPVFFFFSAPKKKEKEI